MKSRACLSRALVMMPLLILVCHALHQCPTDDQLEISAEQVDDHRLWSAFLEPLLIERLPGTAGHAAAKQHLLNFAATHLPGWHVEEDHFRSKTPLGTLNFTNIIMTERMDAPRKLILAAHYDSKLLPGQLFIGATDSAVPCAMIMELAYLMSRNELSLDRLNPTDTSLQLIFFDGEEAFHEWTATDSLYGSRHLAAKWHRTAPISTSRIGSRGSRRLSPARSMLEEIQLFILLDLLGADRPWPTFHQYFKATAPEYQTLSEIEQRMLDMRLLSDTRQRAGQFYFLSADRDYMLQHSGGVGVDDDHKPFVDLGVSNVLHLIPAPFPAVWHTIHDDREALNTDIIRDLLVILRAFLSVSLK